MAYGSGGSNYGLRYAFRSQGLGGIGAAAMSQAIVPMIAAITVGFEQLIDKMNKRLDKQVEQQVQRASTPSQLLDAWKAELAKANIEGGGLTGGLTSKGQGGGLIEHYTGKELPDWLKGAATGFLTAGPMPGIGLSVGSWLFGRPGAKQAYQGANEDALARDFVKNHPADAFMLTMMGAPGSDKLRAELLKSKQISQADQQWNLLFGMSPYAPQPTQYASPTQVVINAGVIGQAQDVETILRRTDRNNGAGSTYTSPSRP